MQPKDFYHLCQRCKHCDYLIIPHVEVLGFQPSPDDFVICPKCNELMRWDGQLKIRKLTKRDIDDIPEPFLLKFQHKAQYQRMFCEIVH